MIGGIKKADITKEIILQRITEYDIYRHFFGEFKINSVTHNKFRSDKIPSFIIGNLLGHLTHKDFADDYWRGNCFSLVEQIYRISYNEALILIDKEFGLGLSGMSTHTGIYKQMTSKYSQPEDLGKRYANIQVVPRKFTHEELAYWNEYYQDIQDLRDNNIFGLNKVYLNKQLFTFKPTELKFGYYYNGFWKIYRPFADKKSKWMPNNVPNSTMEGLENLSPLHDAFINKSKKDYMVVKKILQHTCAVQNEGIGCFTEENVNFLKQNSKRQILSFDSDIVGVEKSQQITKLYDFDYANVPRMYLPEEINDWAALARGRGIETVEKIFKEKGLL